MVDQKIQTQPASSSEATFDAHDAFFKNVSKDGYPPQRGLTAVPLAQPWKQVWTGPKVSADGRLIVACPRQADFGMPFNNRIR